MQNLNKVKPLVDAFRNSNNPQALAISLMKTNPNVRQALNYMKQNGGGQAAVLKLANEKGVDPNEILKMLR